MTMEEALAAWEAAGQHGTREERIARGQKWLPYYAFLASQQTDAAFTLPEQPDSFVAELLSDGTVRPGDTVLDIGAGMGTYALAFAAAGCRVTALEPCPECLEVLRRRAEQLQLQVDAVAATWETFIPTRKYDLVFTAMCPAICNMEELVRMEALAERACSIITVARGSADRHRKTIMAALGIRPKGGMVTEALHYIHALYLSGRPYRMASRVTRSSRRIPAQTVLTQYPVYFSVFGIPETESVPFLQRYLAENAVDDALAEESTLNQVLLTWKPGEKL